MDNTVNDMKTKEIAWMRQVADRKRKQGYPIEAQMWDNAAYRMEHPEEFTKDRV